MSQPESGIQAGAASPRKAEAREPPQPKEYKVVPIRECPMPAELQLCDTPEKAASYWKLNIKTHPYFTPDREYLVVLILNTRRKVKGHTLVSIGTLDTILATPREVFRGAIVACAAAVIRSEEHT